MNHTLKLRPIYFDLIKENIKIYEVRLNDEKRQSMNIGDTITFLKEPNLIDSLPATIEARLTFPTFEAMASSLDNTELGFKGKSTQEIIDTYHSFYSATNEQKYGVVAFKIKTQNKQ